MSGDIITRHFANEINKLLKQKRNGPVILRKTDVKWPPRSGDVFALGLLLYNIQPIVNFLING